MNEKHLVLDKIFYSSKTYNPEVAKKLGSIDRSIVFYEYVLADSPNEQITLDIAQVLDETGLSIQQFTYAENFLIEAGILVRMGTSTTFCINEHAFCRAIGAE